MLIELQLQSKYKTKNATNKRQTIFVILFREFLAQELSFLFNCNIRRTESTLIINKSDDYK